MVVLKQKLLAFYTRRLIKKSPAIRSSIGYAQARHMGILYTHENAAKNKAIQVLATHMQQTGKKTYTLCYLSPQSDAVHPEGVPTYTQDAVNLWGQARHKALAYFLSTPFDYLYHVDLVSNPILDYCLAVCRAQCRIGAFDMRRVSLFEIMVALSSQKKNVYDSLAETMLHYTKALHT